MIAVRAGLPPCRTRGRLTVALEVGGTPYCRCGRRLRAQGYTVKWYGEKQRRMHWVHDGMWSTYGGC